MIDGLPVIDAVIHPCNRTRTAAREKPRIPPITSDSMIREDIVRFELSIGGVPSTAEGAASPLTPSTHRAHCARTHIPKGQKK
jgi:hypothetical protein